MNEAKLNELLDQCNSPIERDLLIQLYPHLLVSRIRELRAQYRIDRYDDLQVTRPDLAFPDMQIVIYCDGFGPRDGDREKLDEAFARNVLRLPEPILTSGGPLELLRMKLSKEPSIRGSK